MRSVLTSLFFTLLLFTSVLLAQTPSTLSIQGVLRDATGAAVADGNYAMTFNLYTATMGGSALWTETQSTVAVQNGVFSVQLGSVSPLSSVAFNQQYYIGVTTGGVEMSPRITLTAAPYAMGFKGTSNVFGSSGNVGIGTLSPADKLTVVGGITADNVHAGSTIIDATATIGVANIGTLNAGPTTTAALTVNGSANVSGNVNLTGAVSSVNILNSGAISTGGATLRGNSISASGDVVAGQDVYAGGGISAGAKIMSGTQYAQTSNADTRMVYGVVTTTGLNLISSNDVSTSRTSAGIYRITFTTAPTNVYSCTATVFSALAASSDYRYFIFVSNQSSSGFNVTIQNTGGTLSDVNFQFIAIVSRDNFGL